MIYSFLELICTKTTSRLSTICCVQPDLFDRQALLHRLMRDKELLEAVIHGFLEDMPKQIAILDKFISQEQTAQAGTQGHKIKGASANIGSSVLQELAHAVEKAGKTDDLDKLIHLMPQLHSSFKDFERAMETGSLCKS